MTTPETPSAAEIADIERILRECEWHQDSTSTNAITLLPPIIRRLLAVVEALAAENARLRSALEADDRSVEASIAYLNSTSGGPKNDVPDDNTGDRR